MFVITICEEATDFTQDDLEDIQDRLRATPPKNHPWGKELKIFCTFNPIFKTHWIRTYFFEDNIDISEEIHKDIVKNPKTTFALKTTWRDNLFYNGQYKNEELRKNMKLINPRKYGVQCNGNWGVLGELIFENWEEKLISQDVKDYDDYGFGLDFGFEHFTAIHEIAMKDNDLYILNEIYKPKFTVSDIIKETKQIMKGKTGKPIICDNARPEAIEEMRRANIYADSCKKGAGSVLEGIEWMQDRKIYVHPSCTGAINEFSQYQWQKDKRTGTRLPKPIKCNDDAMDAIRYGAQNFMNRDNFEYC